MKKIKKTLLIFLQAITISQPLASCGSTDPVLDTSTLNLNSFCVFGKDFDCGIVKYKNINFDLLETEFKTNQKKWYTKTEKISRDKFDVKLVSNKEGKNDKQQENFVSGDLIFRYKSKILSSQKVNISYFQLPLFNDNEFVKTNYEKSIGVHPWDEFYHYSDTPNGTSDFYYFESENGWGVDQQWNLGYAKPTNIEYLKTTHENNKYYHIHDGVRQSSTSSLLKFDSVRKKWIKDPKNTSDIEEIKQIANDIYDYKYAYLNEDYLIQDNRTLPSEKFEVSFVCWSTINLDRTYEFTQEYDKNGFNTFIFPTARRKIGDDKRDSIGIDNPELKLHAYIYWEQKYHEDRDLTDDLIFLDTGIKLNYSFPDINYKFNYLP